MTYWLMYPGSPGINMTSSTTGYRNTNGLQISLQTLALLLHVVLILSYIQVALWGRENGHQQLLLPIFMADNSRTRCLSYQFALSKFNELCHLR